VLLGHTGILPAGKKQHHQAGRQVVNYRNFLIAAGFAVPRRSLPKPVKGRTPQTVSANGWDEYSISTIQPFL